VSTRFILVRHADTPGTVERRFTGSTDVPLTDEGVTHARELAKRLRTVRIDALHVSPLLRCRQTAEPITEITGRKATITDDLRECDFGVLENLSIQEAMEQHGDKLADWFGGEDRCPPDGETWNQVGERLQTWFDAGAERYKDRTVLAVTHGGPILTLVRKITGAPYPAMGVFEVDPASVTVIQLRGGTWRLRLFNDTSHLRDPLLETAAPRRMP
jgi:ribonuclease H / adenosylcobalamin/alpha-ribazole phosphatase